MSASSQELKKSSPLTGLMPELKNKKGEVIVIFTPDYPIPEPKDFYMALGVTANLLMDNCDSLPAYGVQIVGFGQRQKILSRYTGVMALCERVIDDGQDKDGSLSRLYQRAKDTRKEEIRALRKRTLLSYVPCLQSSVFVTLPPIPQRPQTPAPQSKRKIESKAPTMLPPMPPTPTTLLRSLSICKQSSKIKNPKEEMKLSPIMPSEKFSF